jgi:hypothetical protein
MRVALFSVIVVLTAYGCSATGDDNEFGAGGGGGEGGSGTMAGGMSGVGGSFAGSSGVGGGAPGCGEAAKLVYVLSDENDLYSFDPPAKKFTLIGPLACPTSMQPNSMAIDREANAYVNYVQTGQFGDSAGAIFKVSTVDGSCQATNISLEAGWYRLGMGFSTDAIDATSDTLFVTGTANTGETSQGLGRIDFKSGKVVPVGPFTGALQGEDAELTGTGAAKLFGFFTTTPVQVAEIDKQSGAIVTAKSLPNVETPAAWAFSFWGGGFYLYTAPNPIFEPTRTTNVTHYVFPDGPTDTAYMENIGFRIVGAGVSTCAPVEPPK